MINVEYVELDLEKDPGRVVPLAARKGERGALTIRASITDHGEPVDLESYDVLFECLTPDFKTVSDAVGSVSGSELEYTVVENAFSSAGVVKNAYFTLKDASGTVATTNAMTIVVLPTATDGRGASEAYSSEIEELLEWCRSTFEANEAERQAESDAAVEEANDAADRANNLVDELLDGNFNPAFRDWFSRKTLSASDVDVIWGTEYGDDIELPDSPGWEGGDDIGGSGGCDCTPATNDEIDELFKDTEGVVRM